MGLVKNGITKKGAITVVLCLSIQIWMTALTCSAQAGGEALLPEAMRIAVKQSYPTLRLLEGRDVDWSECAKNSVDPGIVVGDFNGDGRPDYAVLLVSLEKKIDQRHPTWGLLNHFVLTVFLAQPDGQFRHMNLLELDEPLPNIKRIDLQKPGVIYDISAYDSTGKDFLKINLAHPGIIFHSCGQYASTFYWDGRDFKSAATGQ